MNRILIAGFSVALLGGVFGCDNGIKDQTEGGPNTTDAAVKDPRSPGGAPTFGTPTGTGFATGDALHGGQGSGAMGYNGTGSTGASNAITDTHYAPEPDRATTQPVLQAPN